MAATWVCLTIFSWWSCNFFDSSPCLVFVNVCDCFVTVVGVSNTHSSHISLRREGKNDAVTEWARKVQTKSAGSSPPCQSIGVSHAIHSFFPLFFLLFSFLEFLLSSHLILMFRLFFVSSCSFPESDDDDLLPVSGMDIFLIVSNLSFHAREKGKSFYNFVMCNWECFPSSSPLSIGKRARCCLSCAFFFLSDYRTEVNWHPFLSSDDLVSRSSCFLVSFFPLLLVGGGDDDNQSRLFACQSVTVWKKVMCFCRLTPSIPLFATFVFHVNADEYNDEMMVIFLFSLFLSRSGGGDCIDSLKPSGFLLGLFLLNDLFFFPWIIGLAYSIFLMSC